MDVQINYLAVVLAAVSSMGVGAFWYGKPGFVKPWMKLARIVPQKKDEAQKSFMRAMVYAMLSSLIMAYVLAYATYVLQQFTGESFFMSAVKTAFLVWFAFQGLRTLQQDSFEGRPLKLTMINAGNMLVTIMVMGLIIGVYQP